MLRKLGGVVIAASVVLFVVTFFHVITHETPSACYGGDCFKGENRWIVAMPGSILAFVAGVLLVSFAGRGYGRTRGPKSFADVDSGAYAPRKDRATAPAQVRTSTWSRAWRNAYGYTGAGELGLGLLFIIAGVMNPDDMSGGFLTGGILSAIGILFLWLGWRAAAKDRLHTTGVEGSAHIAGIEQTGMLMNNNPYVRLDLEIEMPGHPRYEVKHAEIVPLVMLSRLVLGATLPVKVDAQHPSHFVIQWEKA